MEKPRHVNGDESGLFPLLPDPMTSPAISSSHPYYRTVPDGLSAKLPFQLMPFSSNSRSVSTKFMPGYFLA